MLRCVAPVVTLLTWASVAGAQLVTPPRDRRPTPQVGTGAIRGRVIDGATGTGIARARVRLIGPGGPRPSVVVTGESGSFAFTALPAGSYSVTADKTGYQPGRYPPTGQTLRAAFRPSTLADGQVLDAVTVTLFRASAIAGRIVVANGEPVEFAQVQALRLPRSGHGKPQSRATSSTNDLGEFRLAHLDAGKYLVLVVPRMETFVSPGQPDDGEARPIPTFYPGVPSIDLAQPVSVERGGSVVGFEMTLIDGLQGTVTGTVVDSSGNPVSRPVSVSIGPVIPDSPTSSFRSGIGSRPDGTFQFKVSQGEYEIEARMTPQGSGGPTLSGELFGRVRLSVAGDVSGVTIALGSGARVSGRFVFEGNSPPPPLTANNSSVGLTFTSQDGSQGCHAGRSDVAHDGTFTVDGVFGTCVARAGGFARWTARSITHNAKELMDRPIAFELGQQLRDVQVIMTDRFAELAFRVVDERGTATREYVALVFPADKARWTDNQRDIRPFVPSLQQMMVGGASTGEAVSRPDTIGGLPAGEYYVVAIDDVELESMRDPEILERLSHAATHVLLAADGKTEVNLRRIKLADVYANRN